MRLTYPLRWPEERIRAEIRRLDGITGLCGATLPIKLMRRGRSLGIYYSDGMSNPSGFAFSQSYFEDPDFPEAEALDTIRHEYAHYMKNVLYPGHDEPSHGPHWHLCCLQVGANPNRFYNTRYSKHLHQRAQEKAQSNARVVSFLDQLEAGQEVRHPTYGPGVISAISMSKDNARITLSFPDGQNRVFSARWVQENCF